MYIKKEISLPNFEFWSGAKDTAMSLDWEDMERIEDQIEEYLGELPEDTELNDFFWFEEDTIAQILGYEDWESLERDKNGEDEDDEEDEEDEDYNEGLNLKYRRSVKESWQANIFEQLNNHFLDETTGKIYKDELNHSIVLWALNTEKLYKEVMYNTRRKVQSITWESLMDLINESILDNAQIRSEQLKAWLNRYGEGYETIAPAVQELQHERDEGEE